MAKTAFEESGGAIEIVTDQQIFAAQSWLASNEGVFVEPASAASVAGLMKCRNQPACVPCPLPRIPDNATIVCTLTGHGLKDIDSVLNDGVKPVSARSDKAAILSIIENVR
jgi:threonine synthase